MSPDGDGAEILREVGSKGLPTRVVITAGAVEVARLAAVARLGPDSILTQSIDLDTLC